MCLKAHLKLPFLQTTASPFILTYWVHKPITPLFITFCCVLLNPLGKEVFRDELSSSEERVKKESMGKKPVSPIRAVAQLQAFPAASHTASPAAPFADVFHCVSSHVSVSLVRVSQCCG